eukprot:1880430-Prymnesium_polylepis.1
MSKGWLRALQIGEALPSAAAAAEPGRHFRAGAQEHAALVVEEATGEQDFRYELGATPLKNLDLREHRGAD